MQSNANNRYQNCFAKLKQKKQAAFIPFVMLGDPDLEQSYRIITTLIENGADGLELGLPFSDPIADGPVIQAAAIRALNNGTTTKKCFELIQAIRKDYADIPIGLLVYSNLVLSQTINGFYQLARDAGVDSILIADVPLLESNPFVEAAELSGISPIFIATPNACENTLKQIAQKCQGYTYLLSRAGVTGTQVSAQMPLSNIIESLNQFGAPPGLLGFGISTPEQVKQAIKANADGVIVGSAIVKIIEENLGVPNQMLDKLGEFVAAMKKATTLIKTVSPDC